MMNKKRVLVATDLTNGRDAAFERGLAMARVREAEVSSSRSSCQPTILAGCDRQAAANH